MTNLTQIIRNTFLREIGILFWKFEKFKSFQIRNWISNFFNNFLPILQVYNKKINNFQRQNLFNLTI